LTVLRSVDSPPKALAIQRDDTGLGIVDRKSAMKDGHSYVISDRTVGFASLWVTGPSTGAVASMTLA
jgi:hypothetical protein